MKLQIKLARALYALLSLPLLFSPAAPAQRARSPHESQPDTSALDVRIARAEEKAAAQSASDAARREAAEAYLARGNVYYSAGVPTLYKFALGDFRRALRYRAGLSEAREKAEQIESIYESLGRPVPPNGNEPAERSNEMVAGRGGFNSRASRRPRR